MLLREAKVPQSVSCRSESVDIGEVMHNHTTALIILTCDFLSAGKQVVIHVIEQRGGTLAEVCFLCLPVVHLKVDVCVVVR